MNCINQVEETFMCTISISIRTASGQVSSLCHPLCVEFVGHCLQTSLRGSIPVHYETEVALDAISLMKG